MNLTYGNSNSFVRALWRLLRYYEFEFCCKYDYSFIRTHKLRTHNFPNESKDRSRLKISHNQTFSTIFNILQYLLDQSTSI